MAYTGKIYIKEINGDAIGVGQDVTVLQDGGNGYAAYLVTGAGNIRFTEYFDDEQDCIDFIKDGGTTTVVIDDF